MDMTSSSWTLNSRTVLINETSTFEPTSIDDIGVTTAKYDDAKNALKYELFEGYSSELLTFASICCIAFIAIGVPGNLITILALSKRRKTRNATAIFIINLAFSDLLFGCFNLPLAVSTFINRSWHHSQLLCRLFPLLRYGLLAVSLLTILSITINRYIMIGHPRIYLRIYRHRYLAMMIAGTWLGSFSILIPTWRGSWGRFGLDVTIGSCSILPDNNGRSPKEFLFIIAFMVPCFCIIVCYARIFYIVRRAANRVREPDLSNSPLKIDKDDFHHQIIIDENSQIYNDVGCSEESSAISSSINERVDVNRQNSTTNTRTLFSMLKESEMKFIDTSVESDCTSSFPTLETQKAEKDTNPQYSDLHDKNRVEQFEKQAPVPIHNFDSCKTTETKIQMSDIQQNLNLKSMLRSSLPASLNRARSRKTHHPSTMNTSNASMLYPGRMNPKDRHLLKMILVIFLSFVICYLPITITKLWKGVTQVHFINLSGYLLIYLTTCINPIIYVVMSSEYRKAYWNLLICRTIKKKSKQKGRLQAIAKRMTR